MSFRPPSLRSIAAFEAAARHRNFAKAAEELCLSSSAVSHAIRTLERRLDQRLFLRTGRRVTLSEHGRLLAARVSLSLSLLEQAFTGVPTRSRRVKVTVLPSFASRILLPRLGAFMELFPHVEIALECSPTLAAFDDGRTDVGIRFGLGNWAGLQSRPLAKERLIAVASPGYCGGNLPRTITDLAACTFIDHPESSWHLWLDGKAAEGFRPRSTLFIDDSALVIEAAASGYGIALARALLVRRDLEEGRLVRLFDDDDVPAEYSYWVVWEAGSPRNKAVDCFITWLIDEMAHLSASFVDPCPIGALAGGANGSMPSAEYAAATFPQANGATNSLDVCPGP